MSRMRYAPICLVATLFLTTLTVAAARAESLQADLEILSTSPATGVARMVRVTSAANDPATKATPAVALRFLENHGSVFGIRDAATELELASDRVDRLGWRNVSFVQRWRGIPVFGSVLRVHLDDHGRVRAANGSFVPAIDLDTTPKITSAAARSTASPLVAKDFSVAAADVDASAELVIYRTGLVRGVPGENRLAWQVDVASAGTDLEQVLIDATTGDVLDRFRQVYDLRRFVSVQRRGNVVWRENDTLPYAGTGAIADAEINTMIAAMEDTYQLYANLSGGTYLSYDGHDAPMIAVQDSVDVDCPNAVAVGDATLFCVGVATDDVVAHEWTHNYTGATHGLIYAYQPGALNEAYSDMFGEVVDTLNGLGNDSPDILRADGACSELGGSAPTTLTVSTPASVAGTYTTGGAAFNPLPPWQVAGVVEEVSDGSGGTDGCAPLTGFTSGRVALLDRGDCNFVDKVAYAEAAGAVAVIVVNNDGDGVITMGGSGARASIPSVMVGHSDGATLRAVLDESVTITMSQSAADDASLRWLVSEDSTTFGGAIRDMWTPTCFGNAGKVSDVEYTCGEADSGGVHSNSGVPNHAFALAVDGGTYNGVSVVGIGMTKAAHIWWRAMSVYQVPITDFTDHADAIAVSCADLVGATLTDLETGAVSPEVVTTADCTHVAAAMDAVEMRSPPSQCHYQPILAPNPPPVDGELLLDENFNAPPTGWQLSNEGVYSEYDPRDWQWTADVPDGSAGYGAMFALDSVAIGNCQPGSDDQSGVMNLDSPQVTVSPTLEPPVIEVDHWVATETGYDGGNIRLSVNGGPWELVPESAFRFNPYNDQLVTASRGNTNPLAGEPAFTGSDEGNLLGSWGRSIIDLRGIVLPGNSFQIRFASGVDGCNGRLGWYLDAVTMRARPAVPRRGGSRLTN